MRLHPCTRPDHTLVGSRGATLHARGTNKQVHNKNQTEGKEDNLLRSSTAGRSHSPPTATPIASRSELLGMDAFRILVFQLALERGDAKQHGSYQMYS